jgi:hypothetical protein
MSLFVYSHGVTKQNYAQRYISRRDTPTIDLWKFAVRYSLLELEEYCRNDKAVFASIRQTLIDPRKGIYHFLESGIPSLMLNLVVADLVKELNAYAKGSHWCIYCQKDVDYFVCPTCKRNIRTRKRERM